MNTEDLGRLHETLIEILDEIVRICDTNGLNYCLIGGTLIGAVRHQGFIPWDDDVDIVMPRPDYERFCEICETDLSPKYYLHSLKTDKNYWLPFIKVRKHNTVFIEDSLPFNPEMNGIFVDIFPQDYSNHIDSIGQTLKCKAVKAIRRVIACKHINKSPDDFLTKVCYFLSYPISVKSLLILCDKIMMLSNKTRTPKYFVNYATTYAIKNEIMPIESYLPYKKLSFEGKLYNVPCEYVYNLTRVYGDYMKLPPLEKRVTHSPRRLEFE